jgi:hypothetical protein
MTHRHTPATGPRQVVRLAPVPAGGRAVRRVVPLGPRPQTFANIARTIKPRPGIHRVGLSGSLQEHIGADPDILVVEDVARILRCTVDTARRIPRDQLRSIPGPGRRQLYLRDDLLAYVRSRARSSPDADILLQRIRGQVVGFSPGSGRERSTQRRTR